MDIHYYKILTSIFAFLLVIGPAILIHELGHFLFAKRFGVRVNTFSFGFGPKIWSFLHGGTEYRISWIPLGGYVAMAGENPSDPHAGTPDEFGSKTILERAVIIAAGPIANIVLGFLLCVLIFLMGVESSGYLPKVGAVDPESPVAGQLQVGDEIRKVNGRPVADWFAIDRVVRNSTHRPVSIEAMRGGETVSVIATPRPIVYPENLDLVKRVQILIDEAVEGRGTLGIEPWMNPVIGSIKEDGPAALAGLLPGDTILAVGDSRVIQWSDLVGAVRESGGETVAVAYARGHTTGVVPVRPKKQFTQDPSSGRILGYYAIGVSASTVREPRSLVHATASGLIMTIRMSRQVFSTLRLLIKREISFKLMSGPLGIAQGSGTVFREGGIGQLIYFLTLISINLGIINLLPLPLLDGGWIFIFLLYELIRRKPMSLKMQERLQMAGIIFLLGLILIISYNDIKRMAGFETVEEVVEGRK